jgi:hypothetical protein
MADGQPPAVRLGAARTLLEQATKLREAVEIETRLLALEEAVATKGKQTS